MSNASRKLERHLDTIGMALTPLHGKELWSLQQQWREAFARELHSATGKWTRDNYDWHVFSWEYRPALAGNKAIAAYRRLEAGEHLLLSSRTGEEFGFRCNGKPIDLSGQHIDVSVTAYDFSWTMCFTHESHCGPYLSWAKEP